MSEKNIRSWYLRHSNLGKAIGLGLVTFVILTGVVIPSMRKTSEVASKVKTRQREEQAIMEKVRVLSGLNSELLISRLKALDSALPPRKDVVMYLSTVDGLSRELGLVFSGISLSPGDVTEASASATNAKSTQQVVQGINTLETEIKISGSEQRIYDFLKAIENSAPLMQVKDVKVSRLGAEGDSYSLALRLGMLWAPGDVNNVKGAVELFTPKEDEYFAKLTELRSFDTLSLLNNTAGNDGLGKVNLFESISLQTESQILPQESPLPQEQSLPQ